MDTSITLQDVIGRDPFGRFLFRLRIRPWQGAVLALFLSILYMFVLPAVFGVLLPRDGLDRSSIVDRVNLVGFLLVNPLVALFYLWQPGLIQEVYRMVFPLAPPEMHSILVSDSKRRHDKNLPWILGALFGVIVVYLGFVYVSGYIGIRWYSYNWFMAVLLQISRFFLLFMIIVAVTRHMLVAFDLNRIYRHIKLPVLIGKSHYSASFEAITRYGLWFAGFGGVLGFFIAVRFLVSTPVFPEDAIYISLYLVLIPLAFFLPFWQAHSNMSLAREKALAYISDVLQDEYDRFLKDISSDAILDVESDKIISLRAMLELTEKAPTWPYETWDLYKLLVATLSPFIMTGIGVLLDMLI